VIPIRPQATLKKEHGVWVYQGAASDISIPGLIDREREKRLREIASEFPKPDPHAIE